MKKITTMLILALSLSADTTGCNIYLGYLSKNSKLYNMALERKAFGRLNTINNRLIRYHEEALSECSEERLIEKLKKSRESHLRVYKILNKIED